jgi:2-dehydropantoate 2-reductase
MAPRVLVFGAGSIGAVYAWVLSNSIPPSNLTAVCRSNHAEVLKNGFTLNSTLWGNDLKVSPVVARTVSEAVDLSSGAPFDYVIIASKIIPSHPSAAELIKPAVSKGTTIVLIQNGIDIESDFARLYPSNPLLSTVVYLPATQVSPGVVQHKEIELLHVGTYPADAPQHSKDAAAAFVDLINSSGATAQLHDDVQAERWSKLIVNATWNPICALARLRDRQFLCSGSEDSTISDDSLQLIKDAMLEVAAVAQAYGYRNINQEVVEFQVGRAMKRGLPGVQPSMMADALAGKSMEVEAIIGNAVRLAGEKGVPVPVLRTIYLLARGLDRSFALAH